LQPFLAVASTLASENAGDNSVMKSGLRPGEKENKLLQLDFIKSDCDNNEGDHVDELQSVQDYFAYSQAE
jgi:hypothetical protein